jgi:transcription initiation factor TFIID subunit TAF12
MLGQGLKLFVSVCGALNMKLSQHRQDSRDLLSLSRARSKAITTQQQPQQRQSQQPQPQQRTNHVNMTLTARIDQTDPVWGCGCGADGGVL